ncbi:tRNA 2-selenouridine(34) synthase MnmH [Hydrogenimonas sp.]
MALPLTDDYLGIVKKRLPLIDVRAPVEFAKGAFPNAVNLPLMSDEERHLVGIEYKQKGNEAAVALGHRLVSGKVKERRVKAWCDFLSDHPDAVLYCFRGGQRSQIAQQWVHDAGCEVVRLKGGYKAFRRYLMEATDRSVDRFAPLVLGGRTGSGKTLLLETVPFGIDLEGLANHRGSAFGRHISPQPPQIGFENALAYDVLGKLEAGYETLLFEDEGKNVGRLYLPRRLYEHLAAAPLVILETPLEERVEITFDEYVAKAQREFAEAGFEDPLQGWYDAIAEALGRIRKRLGGQRHAEAAKLLDEAYRRQRDRGDLSGHKAWIAYLLEEYYDPMYDYQIARRQERILFKGDAEEVREWLMERGSCTTWR